MIATNDITGDAILSKSSTDAYRDGWDRIFGQKKEKSENYFNEISWPTCSQCRQPWNECMCDPNEDDNNGTV